MKKSLIIISPLYILIFFLSSVFAFGINPINEDFSINISASDIWWIVLVCVVGFLFCVCCCCGSILRFFRPRYYRRRGRAIPPRRRFFRRRGWRPRRWRRPPHP